jgi:hypothetical protein
VRCVALLASVLAVLLAAAPRVRADELPAATRHAVERAWFEGRLGDLDTILAHSDPAAAQLPLRLRDAWWRGPLARGAAHGGSHGDLRLRRLGWIAAGGPGPWPMPATASEREPWPLLSALVRDRVRRDRHGAAGLPEHGPLEAYWGGESFEDENDNGHWDEGETFVDENGNGVYDKGHEDGMDRAERYQFRFAWDMAVRCYRGDEDPEEEATRDRDAHELGNRAEAIWLGALGALLSLSFIASVVVARRRGPRPTRETARP